MKKMKMMKKTILSLCVTTLGCITVGVVSLLPAQAEDTMTVSEAVSTFVMEEGAAIRKGDTKQGIRFNALLSEQAYNVLESAQAEFGMLIVPKDYVTEGYELTVENVFGDNAVYQANVKASEVEEGKKAIIQITEPTIKQVDDEYKIYGSLVGVLDANLARGFIGTAYVCVNGEYYLADYADGLAENNTRSMAYVATRAVEAGDEDSATLQTAYIDPVKDKNFNYTVNKVTVDFDGSIVKETIVSSTAQFATAIEYGADTVFGFKGEGVDSFVGMENAEFNVVYTATPISVVVDGDASATETYAAEELASYISQVTGYTVNVVSQATSTYNNIYVSTDTGLGLAADSFKLSYDANGNVHINGVDDRGTLYGVYEYEESYLGIKFLTENYTHVPVTNKQISSVTETKTYTPSFAYRTYMNNGVGFYDDANVKYSSHLRFISQFSNERAQSDLMNKVQYTMPWMAQGWLQASHSVLAYAAIGAYQSGVTDILTYTVDENGLLTYCAFNGNATSSSYKSAFDTSGSMLDVCYSNSTAKAWVKAGLKYAMENYPDMEYFMLGQADKRTNCNCTDCWVARLKGANKSWLIANFVKEMATYTNSLGYTDKKIVMFAYQDTEVAPKAGRNSALTDMPSNVYVQWAPVDSDRYFELDTTNIEGWKTALGMTDGRFLVWSYEVDFYSYFTYYPTMQTWVENFMTYKELGVELVMMQSSHNTSGIADSYLEAYVASKLLWNFNENDKDSMDSLIESAKSEFIEYFYGAAAKPFVESYYAQFDALYAEKFANGGYTKSANWSFTETELNSLLDLLNQAINATDNETYVNHLNMLALTPRYMLVKYCQTTDSTLANDISSVATLTAEGTSVANDVNLQGLSFTKGNTTIYNVEYDADNRVIGMSVDMPHDTEWSWNAPRFTAEYLDELYNSGVRYVVFNVNSTTQTNNFITYYGTTLDFDVSDGFKVTLVENGGELKFSYVDLSTGNTVGTTLDLVISYYSEGQEAASEIGLTLATNVVVSKNAEANAYTLSNTNGMNSAYFSAEQVNAWMAAGYDAISMNVSFTPAANMTKVVAMNGSSFTTMKALLTDETGNAAWTFILAEDTPIQVWAQNGDNNSSGAFTLSNVALLTHVLSDYAYDENNHWSVCTREGCNYVSDLGAHTYGYTECIGAIDYGCTVCGYVQSRENVDKPVIDFTSNMYGATVYSCVWAVADDARITEKTADSLKYLVYHDNNEVNALSKLYLPRINFANFDKVTVNVFFDTFAWNQQYGLTEDALTNISDTWVDWASHEGTLTFEWVNGSLVMTLVMNGKTLTQTITDADIINGKASAYFCVQAYYERYVTLSGFTFKAPCTEHTYGEWTMGSTVGMKKHACTNCGYEEEAVCTEHTFGNVTAIALGLGTHTCTLCNTTAEVAVDEPTFDFTSNMYGATVYSCVWAVADDARITEKTADSLKYLVYHDNNEVNALSKLYLPRINFANFDKVTVNVFFDTFAWNQQYGLTEDALTNISDTWVDWASHEGTLTFEWVNGSLVMTLVMNGKTLTQTITDADIINGKASAYFCVQAYYERYVTLSGFNFGNVCAHEYGDWTMGSTVGMKKHTCSLCGNVEEVACTEHAFGDWTTNLDTGMKQRTCAICAYVEEIADENNVYGVQYAAVSTTITNTQYDANNRLAGLTVVVPNNMEWSNNSPMLTAEYLNKLYAEGIRKIVFEVNSTVTTNNFITYYGTTLDYDPRDGYTVDIINNGGVLKFSYVDLGNNGNTVATTLTITISYLMDAQELGREIGLTVANGVTMSKDAEGVYTMGNMNGYQGGVAFSAEQVDAWLAQGYVSISMNVSFTASANIDTVVAYSASTSWVTDSTGNATWTFNLKSGEAIDFWVQKSGNVSSGSFTMSNITLKKPLPYSAGYTTVSNEVYDANEYLTGMTMVIPDNTEWSGNSPYFTQAYLNTLYANGIRYITLNVESTTAGYSFITIYNGAANYAAAGSTLAIVENGGDLKFSHVNLNNGGYTVATTLTFAIEYQLAPEVIAAEAGLTLAAGVNIKKTADNAYTISNTSGYQGGVAFSAEQVNAWMAQGYTQITFSVSFTASEDISKVVAYGPTAGWLIDDTGSATWTVTLGADSPIDFWAQSGDTPSTGAFTISNVTLA